MLPTHDSIKLLTGAIVFTVRKLGALTQNTIKKLNTRHHVLALFYLDNADRLSGQVVAGVKDEREKECVASVPGGRGKTALTTRRISHLLGERALHRVHSYFIHTIRDRPAHALTCM